MKKFLFKQKGYAHLDYRHSANKIESKIKNPKWVAHHAFLPLIHVTLNKKIQMGNRKPYDFKKREIYYASHTDSFIYQWYAYLLSEKYEIYLKKNNFYECPIAYRLIDGKCNIDFAKQAFDFIKVQPCAKVFVYDFHSFFDTLDFKILKQNLKSVLGLETLTEDWYAVYKSLVSFSYFNLYDIAVRQNKTIKQLRKGDKDNKIPEILLEPKKWREIKQRYLKKHEKSRGIPQGTSISSVLANVYMINFDKKINDFVSINNGFYRRYSDDIICVLPQEKCEEFERIFNNEVKKQKLELSDKKTKIFEIKNGAIVSGYKKSDRNETYSYIDYLGFSFDGNRILIKNSTIGKFYKKLDSRLYLIKSLLKSKKKIVGEKKLYKNYSHLGEANRKKLQKLNAGKPVSIKHSNFLTYAYKAAEKMKQKEIKHQVAKHWKHIQNFFAVLENEYKK